MTLTIPRSSGTSEAAKRIVAAGLRFQSSRQAQPPSLAAQRRADKETAERIRIVQDALDSFVSGIEAREAPLDTGPKPETLMVKVARIKADACKIFGVTVNDLVSQRRTADAARARQYTAQRLRDETPLSLPQIGKTLGGRDHTTIYHAIKPKQREKVIAWIEKLAAGAAGNGAKGERTHG